MHLIDDDVRKFDELARSFNASGPSHMRKFVGLEHADAVANCPDYPYSRRRIVLCDPLRDMIEIGRSRFPDDYSHAP